MTKDPRDYSTNVEDWWSFYGLADELYKAGFDDLDVIRIRLDLRELFVEAAFAGDWQAPVDPDHPSADDDWWRAALAYEMYFGSTRVCDSVDDFVSCALEGGIESMIAAWLEGVPVEHIIGA